MTVTSELTFWLNFSCHQTQDLFDVGFELLSWYGLTCSRLCQHGLLLGSPVCSELLEIPAGFLDRLLTAHKRERVCMITYSICTNRSKLMALVNSSDQFNEAYRLAFIPWTPSCQNLDRDSDLTPCSACENEKKNYFSHYKYASCKLYSNLHLLRLLLFLTNTVKPATPPRPTRSNTE